MLIYAKYDEATKQNILYGTLADVPAADDEAVVYKDAAHAVITLTANDIYLDNSSAGGVQRVKRLSDGKAVNVYITKGGVETLVIGE